MKLLLDQRMKHATLDNVNDGKQWHTVYVQDTRFVTST